MGLPRDRECGKDKLIAAITSGDWTDACFVEAGTKIKELVDKQPFQEGFLAAAGMARRLGCLHGGRGLRDAAAGPVGARHDAGEYR